MRNFKIEKEENKTFISCLDFPRFKGEITFNSKITDIENIVFFDKCIDVMEIAQALREAGEYIINNSK